MGGQCFSHAVKVFVLHVVVHKSHDDQWSLKTCCPSQQRTGKRQLKAKSHSATVIVWWNNQAVCKHVWLHLISTEKETVPLISSRLSDMYLYLYSYEDLSLTKFPYRTVSITADVWTLISRTSLTLNFNSQKILEKSSNHDLWPLRRSKAVCGFDLLFLL